MSIGLSAKQLWKAWEDHCWFLFFAQPIAARTKGAHNDFSAGTKILVDQWRKGAAIIKAGKPCQGQFDLRMLEYNIPCLGRCEMVRDYLQTEVGLNSEQLARTG